MRKLTIALTAVLALTTLGAAAPGRTAPPAGQCGDGAMVRETLPGGTRWQLCWRIDARTGLVLEQVAVAFRGHPERLPVLKSITLAQLNVPYDSGMTEWNDITSFGFGGEAVQPLAPRECPNGSRRPTYSGAGEPGARVLCVVVDDLGPAQRSLDTDSGQALTRQGHDLVLRSVSKVGWYEYVTEYRLADNGRITARLGATGDLSPNDYTISRAGWPIGPGQTDYATAHHHNAFWRVDFDLADQGQERVEQYDTAPTGDQGRRAPILATTRTDIAVEANLRSANRRWWRVASPSSPNSDGHPRSYEIDLGAGEVYEARPETVPDVTFTQQRSCERFATFNIDPECVGRSILQYVDGEPLTDPVAWVRVGFHHMPRDEDQSPMPMHWQGFDLLPRDLTATNPLAPSVRASINGRP
ncbi:primary-amine oxidase [Micromonospora sp. NPDC127501]|uniref:copper amine oxidase n=1 Tax=Micromonospora sp. NPDC127501 TaxID=3154872 RepID=UPI003322072E